MTTNDWPYTLFCFLLFGTPSALFACFKSHFFFFSSLAKALHVWIQATLRSLLNSWTGFRNASLLFGSKIWEVFSVWSRKPSGTVISGLAMVYRRKRRVRERAIVQVGWRKGRNKLSKDVESILLDYNSLAWELKLDIWRVLLDYLLILKVHKQRDRADSDGMKSTMCLQEGFHFGQPIKQMQIERGNCTVCKLYSSTPTTYHPTTGKKPSNSPWRTIKWVLDGAGGNKRILTKIGVIGCPRRSLRPPQVRGNQ